MFIASHHGRNQGYCENVFSYCNPYLILLSDKNLIHDSQEHDYTKHAIGVDWGNGVTRRVITTRSDGHIRITKRAGEASVVNYGVTL